jgi:hypothetical protein
VGGAEQLAGGLKAVARTQHVGVSDSAGSDTHGEVHVAAALDEVGGPARHQGIRCHSCGLLGPALAASRLRVTREGRRRDRFLPGGTGPVSTVGDRDTDHEVIGSKWQLD